MKRKISATVIADSINRKGKRLTSMILVFPRMVLAEFNTHRVFSRNSASSRAIPFEKMMESVMQDPFIPIAWMENHLGMQGNDFITEEGLIRALKREWLDARDYAVNQAELLFNAGLTKQICNRLLEPFLWHTVIVTSSEWENFFALRAHDAAEIHIQKLAYEMLEAYNNSKPELKEDGEWHIPFGDNFDTSRIQDDFKINSSAELEEYKIKIATARCARISYTNFEGTDDYKKDVDLFNRLSEMGHWSPFEHCAMANPDERDGNFIGWKQRRAFFENENRKDPRVIK